MVQILCCCNSFVDPERFLCHSLVLDDLCGMRVEWIPADFTLHWGWAHLGPASWAAELPSGDRALLQGFHEPQSYSKSPNKISIAN